jgi:hypothetical protein
MRVRDSGVQIEAVTVLEADLTFVHVRSAWTTGTKNCPNE